MNESNHLFQKLFSTGEKDIGFSEKEIRKAEQRLEIDLPKSLRDFYLTQVRNRLINSCHEFARPEHLHIEDSQWLIFYGENQGIWASALHLKDLKVYINYEQQGYEEEAKNLKDFFIVRASCDYGNCIYPYRMHAEHVDKKDIEIIVNKLGTPKSEINPPNYHFKRRLYWDHEDEVVNVFEFDNNIDNGRKSVFVQSFDKDCFEKYRSLNSNITWKILSKNI